MAYPFNLKLNTPGFEKIMKGVALDPQPLSNPTVIQDIEDDLLSGKWPLVHASVLLVTAGLKLLDPSVDVRNHDKYRNRPSDYPSFRSWGQLAGPIARGWLDEDLISADPLAGGRGSIQINAPWDFNYPIDVFAPRLVGQGFLKGIAAIQNGHGLDVIQFLANHILTLRNKRQRPAPQPNVTYDQFHDMIGRFCADGNRGDRVEMVVQAITAAADHNAHAKMLLNANDRGEGDCGGDNYSVHAKAGPITRAAVQDAVRKWRTTGKQKAFIVSATDGPVIEDVDFIDPYLNRYPDFALQMMTIHDYADLAVNGSNPATYNSICQLLTALLHKMGEVDDFNAWNQFVIAECERHLRAA